MRGFLLSMAALLVSCTGTSPGTDKSSGGEGTDTDEGTGSGGGQTDTSGWSLDTGASYNGCFPDASIPVPEFRAINRDGAARDREELLGHPSVMWFFPAAGTPG